MKGKHYSSVFGKFFFLLFQIGIPLFCIVYLWNTVDIKTIAQHVSHVSVWSIILLYSMYLCVRVVHAFQRSMALSILGVPKSVWQVFRAFLTPEFYGYLLPGQVLTGNALLWIKLTKGKHNRTETGVMLALMHMLNLLVVILFALTALVSDIWHIEGLHWVILGAIVCSVLGAGMICSKRGIYTLKKVMTCGIRFLGRDNAWLHERNKRLWQVLALLRQVHPWHALLIALSSIGIHMLAIALFYVLTQALGLPLSFLSVIWIRSLLRLLQAAPLAVSGLGVREAVLIFLLEPFGIPATDAVALSLLFFAVLFCGGFVGWLFDTLLPKQI